VGIAYLIGEAMDKKIFFGLVKKSGVDPPEYELYIINDTDNPVTIRRKASGGFITLDDIVSMFKPKDKIVNITIQPHDYVLFDSLCTDDFEGAGQYQVYVKIEGKTKKLVFFFGRNAGFLGSLIPIVHKYGRVIHPLISDI
jgi:hypothetical protein